MPRAKKKTFLLQTPKGTHDIVGDDYYRIQGLFEKAQEVAMYYGFSPIETPAFEYEELFTRGVGEETDLVEKEMYQIKTKGGDKLALRPEGTAPLMRAYIEHGMHTKPQPVMLYYSGPFFRHERPQKGRLRQFQQFGLEVMGSSKSIADALIIRTFFDILEDIGIPECVIEINSIGDSNCRPAYLRALTAYYKKNAAKLCKTCQQRLKKNPLRLLDCKEPECEELKLEAPDSVGYLCTECKEHFKEVLECLDCMEIPYQLNPRLVRGIDYYTRTVFEIMAPVPQEDPEEKKDNDAEEKNPPTKQLAVCAGGRYDGLAKLLGSRKPIPGIGGAFGYERILAIPQVAPPVPRIRKKPKVYFIQLGFEARLKSLTVIEMLRKANIPIRQALTKDGLSSQLAVAEKSGIPYVIIYGQKEALEETVIVRNMKNRSQETVPLEKLPAHLKRLK